MKRHIIYFIDEDAAARRANVRALTTLLDNPGLEIKAQEPLKIFAEYNSLVAESKTAAFILDQRMKGSGIVTYNGTDLAKYLRGIDGKIPIYILTGYAAEVQDFAGSEHLIEYIVGKDEIEDPNSDRAKIVKARMLRHINVFNDVRDEQEKKFHELLVKSLHEPLTSDEQKEMDQIDGVTTAPIVAAERTRERELSHQLEKLQALLNKGQLSL